MAELEISTLIKITIGIAVVVIVVGGLYLIFKNQIIEAIKNLFNLAK